MQIEKQNRNLGTDCSDTSGTDCSDSMVPITPLRVVPIQRYRQLAEFFALFLVVSKKKRIFAAEVLNIEGIDYEKYE